jgi:hypothetical protein
MLAQVLKIHDTLPDCKDYRFVCVLS